MTFGGTAGYPRAELPPIPDELLTAYHAAVGDLCAGKDRQQIADRLKPVVEKSKASNYFKFVNEFYVDLAESAKKEAKPDADPEHRLADTRIVFGRTTDKLSGPPRFTNQEASDPVVAFLGPDRSVVARLLPALRDRSPTRAIHFGWSRGLPPQPRVCDVALELIEYHALSRFHSGHLHQLPDDQREKVVRRVGEWWRVNKDRPSGAGVRDQLPHVEWYPDRVWMAKTLIRLGEGHKTGDKEFGLKVLLDMVKVNPRSHVAAYAADALAEFGDTTPVDVFYDEWKSWLGRPGLIHDGHIAFYLCTHGKRREWELLHAISLEEFRDGKGPGTGAVWSCVVNSGKAGTNPYAIPILGPALGYESKTSSQPLSQAGWAVTHLEKQVGKDFGYKDARTQEEQRAAIRKAQTWWDEEKAKYTFDYIEANLVKARPAAPKK